MRRHRILLHAVLDGDAIQGHVVDADDLFAFGEVGNVLGRHRRLRAHRDHPLDAMQSRVLGLRIDKVLIVVHELFLFVGEFVVGFARFLDRILATRVSHGIVDEIDERVHFVRFGLILEVLVCFFRSEEIVVVLHFVLLPLGEFIVGFTRRLDPVFASGVGHGVVDGVDQSLHELHFRVK